MTSRLLVVTSASVILVAASLAAQTKSKTTTVAPKIFAQELVTQFTSQHNDDLEALELAIGTGRSCRTVAATHIEDIGEKCDKDEMTAMRKNEPFVEAPTKDDPVYDITQPLHDSAGTLIGAVGMDLKPRKGRHRAAILARARDLLRELERQIPSAERLMEPTAR